MSRRNHIRAEYRLFRKYAPASDLFIAILVFGAVTALAAKDRTLQDPHLLDVSLALAVAILAVVIAAISILSAFLTEDYGVMLRAAYPDDVGEVFYPYKLIAGTAGITVLVSGFGLFAWPSLDCGLRAAVLGLSMGAAVWSTIGAVHLVSITAVHGRMKLRLPELEETYDKASKAQRETKDE